jgi:hypothetical protein
MIRSVAGHPQPDLICRESALVVVEQQAFCGLRQHGDVE